VRLDGSDGFPQARDLPALDWGADQAANLRALERTLRSRLAVRRSFDRRVQQTFRHLGPRRPLLSMAADPQPRRWLLDDEDATYDLARLFQLAVRRGKAGLARPTEPAMLIHRGRGLSAEEQQALDWARRDDPLHVLALDQVVPFFLAAGAVEPIAAPGSA